MNDVLPVLVVDDDESIRDFVSLALSMEGYDVQTAPDGAVALEMVRCSPPAVVLLDMRMPVMDGWDFARAYRQLDGPRAPIVVLTAAHDARARAAEIGADAYLGKPFRLEDLLAIVNRYAELN